MVFLLIIASNHFTRIPYPISGASAIRLPPPPRVCVQRHTHRDERPGRHARRYHDDEVAGCYEVSSAAAAERSRRQPRTRKRAVTARVCKSVLAPFQIGISLSLSTRFPCAFITYNWRPKHVGTRTPSTTSVQENPIRAVFVFIKIHIFRSLSFLFSFELAVQKNCVFVLKFSFTGIYKGNIFFSIMYLGELQ